MKYGPLGLLYWGTRQLIAGLSSLNPRAVACSKIASPRGEKGIKLLNSSSIKLRNEPRGYTPKETMCAFALGGTQHEDLTMSLYTRHSLNNNTPKRKKKKEKERKGTKEGKKNKKTRAGTFLEFLTAIVSLMSFITALSTCCAALLLCRQNSSL